MRYDRAVGTGIGMGWYRFHSIPSRCFHSTPSSSDHEPFYPHPILPSEIFRPIQTLIERNDELFQSEALFKEISTVYVLFIGVSCRILVLWIIIVSLDELACWPNQFHSAKLAFHAHAKASSANSVMPPDGMRWKGKFFHLGQKIFHPHPIPVPVRKHGSWFVFWNTDFYPSVYAPTPNNLNYGNYADILQ